ncbi:Type-1 restriction enzyme EcoKI specificity protein [Patescibacteria group bacterium]|nr:Type-1 restriction enzyme EcoKI specificity protein [Patescibacteria group bacterium]
MKHKPYPKYKPSGIDWIGDIPEGWEVYKVKYLTKKIGSGITPKGGATVYENEGIPLLRSQNIHFDSLRLDDVAYISEGIHNSMKATEVRDGDVLFNITGASIGRCNYWTEGIANVNQHVCIVRPSEFILTKYLWFSLSSAFAQQQVWMSQDGCSREGLNFADFGCFNIFVPTKEEQKVIVDFLGRKISEIDGLIQKIESAIAKLREYRSSLITAAVTGKIDVRG